MSSLYLLAFLVCPIGMAAMMWFMGRGTRGRRGDSGGGRAGVADEADDAALPSGRSLPAGGQHARLG